MKRLLFLISSLIALCPLSLRAQSSTDDNDSPELLKDEFLYNFTDNKPTDWSVKGTSEMISGRDAYHSQTGNAVRITTGNEVGYIEQIVDLTGKVLNVGEDVEGLLHYTVDNTQSIKGALRLKMQWLNASNEVVTDSEDKKFIDNETLLFSKIKGWGTLLFRSKRPANAVKFRFAIEVQPNSVVRLDDFSLKRQLKKAAFLSVLPQNLRQFHANLGKSDSQNIIVQTRNFTGQGSVDLPPSVDEFSVDKTVIPSGNNVTEIKITFTPTKPIKIPRGYSAAPSLTIGTNLASQKVALSAVAIDENNPPKVTVTPDNFGELKLAVGETLTKKILVHADNAIDNINISIEPVGKGFSINKNSLYYFTKPSGNIHEGINDTEITVTFRATQAGTVEGKLVFTSSLMEPFEYKIKATVSAFSENRDENFKKEKTVKDPRYPAWDENNYHFMDTGLWSWDPKTTQHFVDDAQILISQNNSKLSYIGAFIPGQIHNLDFPNGIKQVTVYTAYGADDAKLALEYSFDGGGSWIRTTEQSAAGSKIIPFKIDTHKPTIFRLVLVNDDGVDVTNGYAIIERVKVVVNNKNDRDDITDIKQLVDRTNSTALARLFTEFNDIPHHLNLSIEGWSNFAINCNRGFVSYDQHTNNDINAALEESVAKATLYKATKYDETKPMSTVLISPTLSYSDAVSKELGFRVYKQLLSTGDEFKISIAKLTDGRIAKEEDILDIPYEKLLPEDKMDDGFWYDFLLDLSKYKLSNIDKFVVLFSLKTDNEGDNTSSVILLDDFSWGRSDNPVISAQEKEIRIYNVVSGVESAPHTVHVKTENAVSPVVAKVFGNDKAFMLRNAQNEEANSLPKDGGEIYVVVKTRSPKDQKAILYLATRNGAPIFINLFSSSKSKPKDGDKDKPTDGDDDDDIVVPSSVNSVDVLDSYAYRSGSDVVVVSDNLTTVTVFDLNGNIIKSVTGNGREIRISNVTILGNLILKLHYSNGLVKTIKI